MLAPEDEHTEEDKANEFEARIKAPIVWLRLEGDAIRIEDLQEKRYDDALALIKDNFFGEDVTFDCMRGDDESVEEFLSNTKTRMKDKASLVAVDEPTGNLIAVLVLRIVDREAFTRTLSKVKIRTGKCFSTIMKFYNTLEKPVNIHELYGAQQYLKIYTLAILPSHRNRKLIREMYIAAMRSALASQITVISGIFTSKTHRTVAESLGFDVHNEILYSKYKIDDRMVFSAAVGSDDKSAIVMATRIDETNACTT